MSGMRTFHGDDELQNNYLQFMSSRLYQHIFSFSGDAFKIFYAFKDQSHAFFLDSSLRRSKNSFSYIGFAPFTTIKGGDLSGLKRIFDKYRLVKKDISFPAGAVGYLAYDGSQFFGFYDTILGVDHQKKKLIITSFSKSRIKDILKILKESHQKNMSFPNASGPQTGHSPSFVGNLKKNNISFKSNFTKTEYMKAVRRALEHIQRGDIYQINLSHQIKLAMPHWQKSTEAAAIYKSLRQTFPSEFGAYLDDGKQVILSASPERFLKLQDRKVQVKPMKGTRPRGRDKAEDKLLREQLLKSPKEIAELLMVTDLERNDLGRVCDFGSVKVKVMRSIETYTSVFQATSTIEGRLRDNCDPFDLLKAAFPSGSVTGCPKIEAMKIIKQLERGSRELYTGALGYISFSGDMDFNVMIRTMFLKPDKISFHVGGGIVADSKPADEWQETWDKAKPLIETLKKSFL
jgi:para-aminobenzoate synthetase component 1